MTTTRLPRRAVLRHLDRLGDHLTGQQVKRLRGLADLIDANGRIRLDQALEVATSGGDTPTRLAAFRQFRLAVGKAVRAGTKGSARTKGSAGTKGSARTKGSAAAERPVLSLVVDSRKTPPEQRFCWFDGDGVIEEEVAQLSERTSRRRPADQLIAPSAREVLDPPEHIVYVSTAVNANARTEDAERRLIELLRERASVRDDMRLVVVCPADNVLGADLAAGRQRLRTSADVMLALVSIGYVADRAGDTLAARGRDLPVLAVAMERLGHGVRNDPDLPLATVQFAGKPFAERSTAADRAAFVDDCLGLIAAELAAPASTVTRRTPPSSRRDAMASWTAGCLRQRAPGNRLVDPTARETVLDEALDPDLAPEPAAEAAGRPARSLGAPVAAVDRLVEWASDPAAASLCALLGDVGMGKTTTTQLFTQRLLELRAHSVGSGGDDDGGGRGPVPLPVLFDLRDLRPAVLAEGPDLRRIVQVLLAVGDSGTDRPDVDEVLALVATGDCVLIFDGLDEVLVHLSPYEGQAFTRTLWRATERTWQRTEPDVDAVQARPSKLLISCRTHYFRSIRDEANHFTGQHRDGPARRDYLALLMLPFGPEQIRHYLERNLPEADVDGVLALIDGIHNLREIAERPLTLRMITEQLELIERAKAAGRTVHAVDLYRNVVQQWLDRDNGKHNLLSEHKLLLMEHLAADLWRTKRAGWTTDDVEQWMLEFLAARPGLEIHYGRREPDLWKEDLRTATFLVRRDDDMFAFAHTSLREFFLARYLLRALEADTGAGGTSPLVGSWDLPVPGRETLHFLGQLLARLDGRRRQTCLASLQALGTAPPVPGPDGVVRSRPAQLLAFAYGIAAVSAGFPHQVLAGSRLDGADLRGWTIRAGDGAAIDLRGVVLARADLTGAVIRGADLRGCDLRSADLTRAEVHDSDLGRADLARADLTGTVFRHCDLADAGWEGCATHRTQLLGCRPSAPCVGQGTLVAPLPVSTPVPPGGRLAALSGHDGEVLSVGFSRDGSRIVSGGVDGSVRVWDAVTGELVLTVSGHGGWVLSVGFSRDGSRVVSGGGDGSVRVWDAVTGEQVLTVSGHGGGVLSVGFSRDGSRVVSGGEDGSVRVWDAVTGEQVLTVSGHGGGVWSVGFSPDGSRVVSGGEDGSVRVWDAVTGEQVLTVSGHGGWVLSVGFSRDGSRVVSGGVDGSVRVWDAVTGEQVLTVSGHGGWVLSVGFSRDGSRVVSGGEDGSVRVWDAVTGEQVLTVSGHGGRVWSVGFSPDGSRVVSGGEDGSVRVWDAVTGEQVLTLSGHGGRVWSVGFSPDGSRVVSGGEDGSVRVWDAVTGEQVLTLAGHDGEVWSVGFSPDGSRIVSGGEDGSVRVWDAVTGEQVLTVSGHGGRVLSVGFSRDGSRVVSGGVDGSVRVWDAVTGELVLTVSGHGGRVWSVGFSRDGSRVVSGGGDGSVRVWDAVTELVLTVSGHGGRVLSVGFSPDGSRVVSGGDDGSVRVWDAVNCELVLTVSGHGGRVLSVGFSRDGSRVVSGGVDGSVRVWDAVTGEPVLTLSGHGGRVWSVGFSPDGSRVVSGGVDGSVRVWDAVTGEQVGWQAQHLPDGEMSIWSVPDGRLLGASAGAWRWLGWLVPIDGRLTRLPAETYGPLPPLRQSSRPIQ